MARLAALMKTTPILLVAVLLLASAPQARAEGRISTAAVTKETLRTSTADQRLINFWWLPLEFWEAAAREQKMSEAEVAEIHRVFRDYVLVAALEARVGEDQRPQMASIGELVQRMKITRNGKELEVLRQINPRLAEFVPKLIYALQASLSILGEGLHVLPLNNADAQGNPILLGSRAGMLRIEFKPEADAKPMVFEWAGPLTAVKGTTPCPKGGEKLEANWAYCPWHGVKSGNELQPANATSN